MRKWKSIKVGEGENILSLSPGDEDGFHISEEAGDKVYVYYSEREHLIEQLQKVKQ